MRQQKWGRSAAAAYQIEVHLLQGADEAFDQTCMDDQASGLPAIAVLT
jgi:hypothetical protein